MKYIIKRLPLFIAFLLLLSACSSKQDRMKAFVSSYNKSARHITSGAVVATGAKVKSDSQIIITIFTSLEASPELKTTYDQLIPELIGSVLKSDKTGNELINKDNVSFEVIVLAKDDSELTKVVLDKKRMKELLANEQKQSLDDQLGKQSFGKNANISPDLRKMLTILNRSLPIIDKENGTKVFKIDVDEHNELVYSVEVTDTMVALLKGELAQSIMKESILSDPNVKVFLKDLKRTNLRKVRYDYLDSKGALITSIFIDRNDFGSSTGMP